MLTNISIAVLVQMVAQQSERGFPEGFQKAVPLFPPLPSIYPGFTLGSVKPFYVELRFASTVGIWGAARRR
jgi:hypothetical protein